MGLHHVELWVSDLAAARRCRGWLLGERLNHLALHAGSPAAVARLYALAPDQVWSPLFAERYPHAGGADHYAAYLEDGQGFEVQLCAGG